MKELTEAELLAVIQEVEENAGEVPKDGIELWPYGMTSTDIKREMGCGADRAYQIMDRLVEQGLYEVARPGVARLNRVGFVQRVAGYRLVRNAENAD